MGDTITLKKDDQEYQVKIAVITENYAGHYVYMTPKVYEEIFGETPDYADIVFYCKRRMQRSDGRDRTDLLWAIRLP